MPEGERPKAHQEDAPQSVHKGLGVRDREIALLIKKIDFFDKLERLFKAVEFRFCA